MLLPLACTKIVVEVDRLVLPSLDGEGQVVLLDILVLVNFSED